MKMHSITKIHAVDLNKAASRYKSIQDEIANLEKELQSYRAILEDAALSAPHMSVELKNYRVSVSPSEREVFALKEAREKLTDSVLRPFLRLSKYNRLKVSEKAA